MKRSLSTGLEADCGLASLVVLVAHALQWFVWPLVGPGSAVASATQHAAHFAVLVFFALSGYVISFSMSRNAADSGVLDEAAYIRARAIRILPPFVFAFVFSLLIAGVIEAIGLPTLSVQGASGEGNTARTTATSKVRNVVASALLSNGIVPGTGAIATNGPLWSLSFEVWLYLLAMLAWIVIEGKGRTSASRIAAVGLAIFTLLQIGQPLKFAECAAYWTLGAALFFRGHVPAWGRMIDTILIGILAIGCMELGFFWKRVWPLAELNVRLFPAKAAILLFMILLFAQGHGNIPHALKRPFIWLAGSSYTLYITHFPLLMLLYAISWKWYASLSSAGKAVFLTLACALICWFCHAAARYLEDRRRWAWLFGGAAR